MLVPVDFSAGSDAALDAAIELASALGAELHVMHACELCVPMVMTYEVVIPPAFIEETRKAAETKLARELKKVCDVGITGESHLTDAPAATAAADLAQRIGADLIVIGTRGNTGVKHALLGSVAEHTVRIAPCPVLTIRTPD
jgi:nucleotide-binding universal stress UspA family protein